VHALNLLYQELLITYHGEKIHQRKKIEGLFYGGHQKEINSLAYEHAMCLSSGIHWFIGSRLAWSRRQPRHILSIDISKGKPFDGEVARSADCQVFVRLVQEFGPN